MQVSNPGGSTAPELPRCPVHAAVATATCARCGRFCCEACTAARPDGTALCVECQARAHPHPLPWDRRRELGTLRALAETCWLIAQAPQASFASAEPTGSIRSSLLFAGIWTLLASLPAMGRQLLELGKAVSHPPQWGLVPAFIMAAFGLAAPLFSLLGFFVTAALDHAVLRLSSKGLGPWPVTLRGAALTTIALPLVAIPYVGHWASSLGSVALKTCAYRGLHRIGVGRAALGALIPTVLGELFSWALFLAASAVIAPRILR